MLELRHNQLHFSFPEIVTRLRVLTDEHAAAHLPSLLVENRAHALEQLFADRWRYYAKDREFRERAGREAKALGADELARSFHLLALRMAGLPPENDGGLPTDTGLASAGVGFQRTLRIPDDGKNYPLPAGLGLFTLRMVDDHAATVPPRWNERGGVMMPMYQAEAMWLSFSGWRYPFALKIAAGKINAVNGRDWEGGLHQGSHDAGNFR